ncbi:hypothetical protein [Streptomyces caelestis]|uniref:hypothetical protein n=1 Tax=Streptomyces caelestis TaxID=36816 RepID=UPI003656EF70
MPCSAPGGRRDDASPADLTAVDAAAVTAFGGRRVRAAVEPSARPRAGGTTAGQPRRPGDAVAVAAGRQDHERAAASTGVQGTLRAGTTRRHPSASKVLTTMSAA